MAAQSSRIALAPGVEVDGFRLEERVHQGGMATLWRVTKPGLDLPLLMKVPRLGYGDDPTAIVGFEMEQMVLSRLSGPHVPRFVAAGDFSKQPYIVMEYIPGTSLRARLDAAPLPPDEVAHIGAAVATALHDLHRQHAIHLDLKPSNVLFRAPGVAVLVDFGLAHHDQMPDLLAEEFRLPMGTGPYISPEQVRYVRNDPRSDLFALGVMLYHLATGQRPFGNPTSVRGLRRRLYRDPVPPRALRSETPAWLQEVILRCLEVDPAERYATGSAVAFDLQHPDEVPLTHRAERRSRDALGTVMKRWFSLLGADEASSEAPLVERLSRAPFLMAAVDVSPGEEQLGEAIQRAVARTLETLPGARLACVSVMKTHRIGLDVNVDAEGRNRHVQQLVELKHWARPLRLDAQRVTYHVLESPDPPAALVEYARVNQVDHIVLGARGSSPMRRLLGSVSVRVVAEAPCTVTVVRLPQGQGTAEAQPAGAAAEDADAGPAEEIPRA